jgi:uncharacterized protein YdaU (DUF1376 family)
LNYYPFHIGDYVSATRHLSWEEDAAYRRLLDTYYTSEKPLPKDIRAVCRLVLATTDSQREAVSIVLSEFFVETDDGWINSRADEEIEVMKEKQQKQRDKANKRWHKPETEHGNAPAMPRHTNTDAVASNINANAMPPTPTPTPTPTPKEKHSEAKASGGKPPPMSPDEIIFGYGIPMLTNAGVAEKHARSFLGGLRREHGDGAVIDRLRDCMRAKPLQPLEWLAAALPPNGGKRVGKHAQLESRNAVVVADWQPPELRGVA